MNGETQLMIELWEAVRDHLPASKRVDAAENMMIALQEYGIDGPELSGVVEEDPDLAEAFATVFHDDDDDSEDDH